MKKSLALLILSLVALGSTSLAATPELAKSEIDRLVAAVLPVCPEGATISTEPLQVNLGEGLRASIVRTVSDNPWCLTQALALGGPGQNYYLGSPWILVGLTGTPAQKIKEFAWSRLQQHVEPTVTTPAKDGFFPVTLTEKTEFGPVRISGHVDVYGTIFVPGALRTLGATPAGGRNQGLAPIAERAPWKGASSGKVTIYEFSDFQCPACKRTKDYSETVVKAYGDKVRLVRIDLPLISSHPWAFSAAVMGRAIWKQNPEAFWDYKDQVYENQENLNTFTLEDFARGFAKEQGLDLARFDSDVQSATIRDEILAGIGIARSMQINGTPTFLVDGQPVIPGDDAKNLLAFVGAKLK